jgi:hypothetical protein
MRNISLYEVSGTLIKRNDTYDIIDRLKVHAMSETGAIIYIERTKKVF